MSETSKNVKGTPLAWISPGLSIVQRVALFISTAGGAGNFPVAPGTAGSVVGVLLFVAAAGLTLPIQFGILFLIALAGWWGTSVSLVAFGTHDDSRVVIDEVLGVWITLIALPHSATWILAGFFLFRLLDILKPFPANVIDRKVGGAMGVLLDDVVAGIYGRALLALALYL